MDNSEKKDWEAFAKAQVDTIMKIKAENQNLQSKIKHLEKLLENSSSSVDVQEVVQLKNKIKHLESLINNKVPSSLAIASNEEELCKIEIARLFDKAKDGPLEFEEVKIFDIYVKSLLAIKGKPSEVKNTKKKEEKLSQNELLELASQMVADDTEQ